MKKQPIFKNSTKKIKRNEPLKRTLKSSKKPQRKRRENPANNTVASKEKETVRTIPEHRKE